MALDLTFLDGIFQPVADVMKDVFVDWLGFSESTLLALLTLGNMFLLWMKGRWVLDILRTYWNVLGVLLVVLIVGLFLGLW